MKAKVLIAALVVLLAGCHKTVETKDGTKRTEVDQKVFQLAVSTFTSWCEYRQSLRDELFADETPPERKVQILSKLAAQDNELSRAVESALFASIRAARSEELVITVTIGASKPTTVPLVQPALPAPAPASASSRPGAVTPVGGQ